MNWKHAHDHPHGSARERHDEDARGDFRPHPDEPIGARHGGELGEDFVRREHLGGRGGREHSRPPWRDAGVGREQARGFRGRGPKNYTRSDERIREDISERLWDADDVDASDVSVEVRDAVVSLRGSVEHRWIKHRIEDIADACGGVRDISNEIRVQSRSDWPYDKRVAPDSMQGVSPETPSAGGGTMSALEEEMPPRSH